MQDGAQLPERPEVYTLAGATVRVYRRLAYCESVYPDGALAQAVPHDTAEYALHAAQHGYPPTPAGMAAFSRDHEILHHLIAAHCGRPHSTCLWLVAHGTDMPSLSGTADGGACGFEETVVLHAQRWLRTGEWTPGVLGVLNWLDVDLAALREAALAILYPDHAGTGSH